jgi:hypothetical protein
MRILLCNHKTGLYYQTVDSWTPDPASAQDFGSSLKAALFAQENGIGEARVYLDFGDREYNVTLPVPLG